MQVNGPFAKRFEKDPNSLFDCMIKRTHTTIFPVRRDHIVEIARELKRGLQPLFGFVDAKVVECPNLTRKPFNLPRSGISGENTIACVGSHDYILPSISCRKQYDLMDVANACKVRAGEILGGGTGPYPTTGHPCEMVAELCYCNGSISCNRTLHAYSDKSGSAPNLIKATDTKFHSSAQLFVSEGNEGWVIEVIAKRRLCEGSIGKFLHQALQSRYGRGDEPMALGGVFLLEGSGAKYHVLSELPNEPYHTFPDLKSYLKCFEMKAPIIGMGTVLSHDPNDLGLHMHSFHIYNVERNVAGHLETDTDPEAASYRIFLHPASHICRMDKPVY
uniref:Ester hydrolase C11orf54 homolog n=1 Tax=Schistocephalus solidus TaxID=70667 RepID=A0A0X3PY77_SCHSO